MPQSISEAYSELYHYTGVAGIKGIIESQTLWATHCRYLNDGKEIKHYEQRLSKIIRPDVDSGIEELVRQYPENQSVIDSWGGKEKAVDDSANGITSAMYQVVFTGKNGKAPFAEPYITSFCKIDKSWEQDKKERTAEHGILSQWRAYGKSGGYAIVFDTANLKQLLSEEHRRQNEILFCDVVYSNHTDTEIPEEFLIDENTIKESIRIFLHKAGDDPNILANTYSPFCRNTCRYKHWGFEEEQEIRIITIPISQNVRDFEIPDKPSIILPPEKPIKFFTRGGTAVPYIELFKDITIPKTRVLPIKRIIVGPHPDKEKRKRAIELLLLENHITAKVSVSDIPYIETGD